MKKARAKKKITENSQCFGDLFGVTVTIELDPNQTWYVQKRAAYWYAHRKGGVLLRLTDAAFNRLFEIQEETP